MINKITSNECVWIYLIITDSNKVFHKRLVKNIRMEQENVSGIEKSRDK